MDKLSKVFFDVLLSHNHEIVMSGEWLINIALELEQAAIKIQTGCTCPLIDDRTMGINPDCVVHGELANE